MSLPPALSLYRMASWALGPALSAWVGARARAGKEDPARLGERYGRASAARPDGPLVWLHGASVGELGVVLQLREALAERNAALSFLVTTGTRTSAGLFARRAPNAVHQYAPMDRADCVRRFLAHWRPDLGVFVESELWPNLALEAEAAGARLALVNARMSAKTIERWKGMRQSAKRILDAFDPILAADAQTAEGLSALSNRLVPAIGNLKLAAAAPHVDESALAALTQEIGRRPVWLAASTHLGEEEILLNVHARIRAQAPDALLILAVRHPERGASVAGLADGAPRRAKGEPIGRAPVYVVDTIGELGLFYRLAPVALVAGSLQEGLSGHNPIEPAKLGAAILAGPYVESFADLYDALHGAGGAWRVESPDEIEAAVLKLWADAAAREKLIGAARALAESGAPALRQTIDALMARAPDLAPARAAAYAGA
ncbi:MAG: 3-deoxy-D-manno-octulosonic acid transferase [Hyphomonadaceae bacterium]